MPDKKPKLWVTATRIVQRLRDAGHQAFFAGGCVRDLLLGIEPQDVDIATSARPDEVRALFPRCLNVGESFGVMIVLADGHQFEVATFRTETGYENGRRPTSVSFADARQDVERRDFTINGLLLDPLDNDRVIDYVGGQADLENRVLRAIGNPEQRFAEDHLRMLRAVRFAARFELRIDAATYEAVQTHAAKIHLISAERIRDELMGIFTGSHPDQGLDLLDASGLLREVLPEVQALKAIPASSKSGESTNLFEETREMLRLLRQPSEILAFGVLFHAAGPAKPQAASAPRRSRRPSCPSAQAAEKVCRRLRFSVEQIHGVGDLVASLPIFETVQTLSLSALKRFLRKENFQEHLELHRLKRLASGGDLSGWDFCRQKLLEIPPERLSPPRLITGEDLQTLGFEPGPLFKRILLAVEDAQLDETIRTREEALELVRQRWPQTLPPQGQTRSPSVETKHKPQ